jgi:hypothetical protein
MNRENKCIEKIRKKKYLENDQHGPGILKISCPPQLVLQEELSHQPTKQQNKENSYWELQSLWTRKGEHGKKAQIYTIYKNGRFRI